MTLFHSLSLDTSSEIFCNIQKKYLTRIVEYGIVRVDSRYVHITHSSS